MMRSDSTGGRLIAVANCHRCASLSRVWDMPETPTIWVLTRAWMAWAAIQPAKITTTVSRIAALASFSGVSVASDQHCQATKPAT